jgi:hypothetical protein
MLSCAAQWQIVLGLAAVWETLTAVEGAARPKMRLQGLTGALMDFGVPMSHSLGRERIFDDAGRGCTISLWTVWNDLMILHRGVDDTKH